MDRDDLIPRRERRQHHAAIGDAPLDQEAVEERVTGLVEDVRRAEGAHAAGLQALQGREHVLSTRDLRDPLEGRAGLFGEDPPCPRDVLAFLAAQNRALPGMKILAGIERVAGERTRNRAPHERKWVGPPAQPRLELAEAEDIGRREGAAHRPPQSPHRRPVARGGGSQQRGVVIGEVEVGELDDAQAPDDPQHQRKDQGDLTRGAIANGDDQRGHVRPLRQRLVPTAKPGHALEGCRGIHSAKDLGAEPGRDLDPIQVRTRRRRDRSCLERAVERCHPGASNPVARPPIFALCKYRRLRLSYCDVYEGRLTFNPTIWVFA